jgi:hypothetical protein
MWCEHRLNKHRLNIDVLTRRGPDEVKFSYRHILEGGRASTGSGNCSTKSLKGRGPDVWLDCCAVLCCAVLCCALDWAGCVVYRSYFPSCCLVVLFTGLFTRQVPYPVLSPSGAEVKGNDTGVSNVVEGGKYHVRIAIVLGERHTGVSNVVEGMWLSTMSGSP